MKKETINSTIFDDVFRTMVQKMPQLLIPVINEVFQTHYTENDYFSQLRNEHEELYGKNVTDSIIQIGKKLYHIECQSTEDSTMIIRMIEYDFAIALEQTLLNGKPYEMDFPNSCVLYLRHTNSTPNELELKVNLPQGGSFLYKTPIIKVQQYTRDVIFQKKLLFFLPYYIMRYERLGDIMGGKILELESERLLRIGREEGREEGSLITMITMYRDGKVTLEEASDYLGISVEEFIMREKEYK